jgi:hypothetical protein
MMHPFISPRQKLSGVASWFGLWAIEALGETAQPPAEIETQPSVYHL